MQADNPLTPIDQSGYVQYIWCYVRQEDDHGVTPVGIATSSTFGHAKIVLRGRYLAKSCAGTIDETPAQLFWRVASDIAQAERLYPIVSRLPLAAQRWYDCMTRLDFLPNSPTLMNAGRRLQQLSACFVLPVEDSLASIYDSLKHQALIHQSGGGTGFSFGHVRPHNDRDASSSSVASGPISFMRLFNLSTDVIKQGGTRRGANMGILPIDHPDILDFIALKESPTEMTNFNLSGGITDSFMQALARRRTYALINPHTSKQIRRLPASLVFDRLVEAAWRSGEPGLVFLDTINRTNPTPPLALAPSSRPTPAVNNRFWPMNPVPSAPSTWPTSLHDGLRGPPSTSSDWLKPFLSPYASSTM